MVDVLLIFGGCGSNSSNTVTSKNSGNSTKNQELQTQNADYDAENQKSQTKSEAETVMSTLQNTYNSSKTENIIKLFSVSIAGKYGYINEKGKIIIKPQFDYAASFKEGFAKVEIDNKYGYINEKGKIVIKPQYSDAYDFSEGLAAVKLNNKMVYIDKNGKEVIDQGVTSPYGFSDGLAPVKHGEMIGFMNTKGKVVIPAVYKQVSDFSEGLAAVLVDQKYGFIDKSGKMIIKPQFDYAQDFKEELSSVLINSKCGYINKEGKIVIKPVFDTADSFSEDMAAVCVADKFGYIDKKGNILIKPKYKAAQDFKEGLAWVNSEDTNGYIDKTGAVVIKLQKPGTIYPQSFSGGAAYISDEVKNYYLNKDGSILWEEPSDIEIFKNVNLCKNIIRKNSGSEIIAYPQFKGMGDKSVQNKLNSFLNNKFGIEYNCESDETLNISYKLQYAENGIVNIIEQGYSYYKGAAHGNSTRNSIIMNVKTGETYTLENLFKKDTDYISYISDKINEQIKKSDIVFIEKFTHIDKDEQFYLTSDGIVVFFPPYKYTPYAAGFVEFKITYEELKDMIGEESPLNQIKN